MVVSGIGIVRRIEAPVKVMPVHKPVSAIAKAATTPDMRVAVTTAAEGHPAATETTPMERCAATTETTAVKASSMEAAAAESATTTMKSTATMSAMSAAHFNDSIGSVFRHRRGRWTDRRQRLGPLAGGD